jgi:hypothetical protein
VHGDTLLLLTTQKADQIAVDLSHVEAFVEAPVRYRRFALRKSNPFYAEPAFIRAEREVEQKINLENQRRREEKERVDRRS